MTCFVDIKDIIGGSILLVVLIFYIIIAISNKDKK
jgi:hypothetical protein